MSPTVRSELLKIRSTRTFVVLVLAGVGFAGFLGFVTTSLAGEDGNAALGSAEMIDNVVGVSTIPAAFGLLLGVLLAAGEHQHRTITTTFLVEPRRHLVVAAKGAAAAITAAAVSVGMIVAALLGSAPRLIAEGASVRVDGGVATTVAGLVVASGLLAVVGVLLGHLVRSQVAAAVAVVLEFTLLEGIADTVAGGGLRQWLPGGAATSLAGGGGNSFLVAAVVLAAWAVAAAAIAVPAVVRRDVE